MADKDSTLNPHGLILRGNNWHIDCTIKGRRIRKALGTKNKEEAIVIANAIRKSADSIVYGEGENAPISWVSKVYHAAKRRAREKGIPFNLTKKEADKLFADAGSKCQLTGLPFSFKKDPDFHKRPWIPTMDRIDNSKGYSVENCRIICLMANIAINEWGESLFKRLAVAYITA